MTRTSIRGTSASAGIQEKFTSAGCHVAGKGKHIAGMDCWSGANPATPGDRTQTARCGALTTSRVPLPPVNKSWQRCSVSAGIGDRAANVRTVAA